MSRPPFRKPTVIARQHGVTITRQLSEFGALYHVRRGDAPALYTTNRQDAALAWLAGYREGLQAHEAARPLVN